MSDLLSLESLAGSNMISRPSNLNNPYGLGTIRSTMGVVMSEREKKKK
jgi:hypothetical protein